VKASERLLRRLVCGDPFDENPFDENGWDDFYRDIQLSGLGPAFFLNTRDFLPLSETIRNKSRRVYENSLLFKDYAVCSLKELAPALMEAGGRVVIIQGLALCDKIYQEPSIRPMGDVDLYFPDGSVNAAREAFLRNGFEHYGSYADVLCKKDLRFDLHEDLWGASRIARRRRCIPEISETFTESSLVPGFFIPSPTLLAVHSAYHSIKHSFSRMLWCRDLFLLYKAGYFNGIRLEDRSGTFPRIAIDHLRRKGLIENDIAAFRLPCIKQKLFRILFSMPDTPGIGECALALSLPGFWNMVAYAAESCLPRKKILLEMYGKHSYLFLVVRRIFTLITYVFGILTWRKHG
jgi:hypothetical protein